MSLLATFGLLLSSSIAVVASPIEAHKIEAQALESEQQHFKLVDRAAEANQEASDRFFQAEMERRDTAKIIAEWKDCEHNNGTSEWGEIYGGCHSGHGAFNYVAAAERDQFQMQVRALMNTTVGLQPVNNNPRSKCTKEQGKPLCVSWSNDIADHIEPDLMEISAEKASNCMFRWGYSTELALWTFSGERVYVCISDRADGCKARICTSS